MRSELFTSKRKRRRDGKHPGKIETISFDVERTVHMRKNENTARDSANFVATMNRCKPDEKSGLVCVLMDNIRRGGVGG